MMIWSYERSPAARAEHSGASPSLPSPSTLRTGTWSRVTNVASRYVAHFMARADGPRQHGPGARLPLPSHCPRGRGKERANAGRRRRGYEMRRFRMPLAWLAHFGPEKLSVACAVSHLGVRRCTCACESAGLPLIVRPRPGSPEISIVASSAGNSGTITVKRDVSWPAIARWDHAGTARAHPHVGCGLPTVSG
jgi:hypothetical protein